MATSTVFRSVSPLCRCVILTVLLFTLIASVHLLDLLPGWGGFTSTAVYGNNRLQQQPNQHEYMETNISPGDLGQVRGGKKNSADACESDLAYLKDLGLSKNIRYSRRCIKSVFPDDVNRDALTNVSAPLIIGTTTVNLDDLCGADLESLPCESFELPVPRPGPESVGQYSHLLFGIATSSQRLRDSKQSFGHWLADSGATLVCMITDEPKELLSLNSASLEAEYAASGIKLKLVRRQDMKHSPEQSHMMLVRDLLAHSTGSTTQTHWLGILDDDTFFPSLHALSTELARHDHTHSQYLGALTENADALHQGVLAAWGGAGIFLSLPLAKEIEPHLDGCLGGKGGDMLIMECIHAHSRARLTMVAGLWQMDFMGDTAGIYESGRRMLSMHHWKSWHWLPVREMAAVTWICGDCFLQRFVFGAAGNKGHSADSDPMGLEETDGVTVLNVGYSINLYTGAEGLPDLASVEQTWDGTAAWKDYEWSVGPLRPPVDKQTKKTWWLKTSVPGKTGGLTQLYLHEGKGEGKDDEVVELIWQSS